MKYLDEYYKYLKFELCLENKTIETYLTLLKQFDFYLENNCLLIEDLEETNILLYLNSLNVSDSSKSLHKSVLRSYFTFLYNKNYIDNNITEFLKCNKNEERLIETLTIEEVNKLINETENILDCLIILLLFKTGIRVSELVNIKSNDLNINDYSIKIHGKGNKERIVLFDNQIRNILIDYFNENKIKDFLLIKKDKQITRFYVYELLQKLKEKAHINKNVYPHILRHTFATYMLKNGTDLRLLQMMLGHSDIKTTTIYTHLLTEHLSLCYNKYHPFGKGNIKNGKI